MYTVTKIVNYQRSAATPLLLFLPCFSFWSLFCSMTLTVKFHSSVHVGVELADALNTHDSSPRFFIFLAFRHLTRIGGLLNNLLTNQSESFFDVVTSFSTSAHVDVVVLPSEVFSCLKVDCLGTLRHIAFVTCNDNRRICLQVFPEFQRPLLNFTPWIIISHVVHNESTRRPSVVNWIQCVVSFLASSIPDSQLHSLLSNLDFLFKESSINGTDLIRTEFILDVPLKQRCLTHTSCTQKNNS